MASVVEGVVKVHDGFSIACGTLEKQDTDARSSASENTSNTAFSSFRKLGESPTPPDSEGDAERTKAFSGGTNSESTNGSEALQDDGPSTPMRYVARSKHIHAETPDSAESLPSLSLATGSHSVDKAMIKQETAELNKVGSPSGFLEKPEKKLENILKYDSSNFPGSLGTAGASEMSQPTGFDIPHPKLHQHISALTQSHIPVSCSSVGSAFSVQPPRVIPGPINSIACSVFNINTKQQIMFNKGQQVAETTKCPQVISAPGVPFSFRQGMRYDDVLQGSASRQTLRNSSSVANQLSYSNINGGRVEALNYMPQLQTSLMAAGLGVQQLLNNDDKSSVTNKNNQPFAKKRKLVSQNHPVSDSTAELNQHALEARQRLENAENQKFEVGGQLQKKQVKRFRSPNNKVENVKLTNGFTDFQSMNSIEKLNNMSFATMKSNASGAMNSSLIHIPYALGINVDTPSPPETGETPFLLSLEAAKSDGLADQSRTGKTEGQSSDDRSHPLGLRLLTFPAYAPLPASVSTFSSGGPTLPQHIKNQGNIVDSFLAKRQAPKKSSPELEWGKFLALSATPDTSFEVEQKESETLLPYQKRFMQLQSFLKKCDEPNQNYLKTLRSLSAASRSGCAVELETRAIMLSLEEGKEINRMKALNVLAKNLSTGANEGIVNVSTKPPKIVSNP